MFYWLIVYSLCSQVETRTENKIERLFTDWAQEGSVMSDQSLKEKYPHWKDALLNNDLRTNLRCGVKYVFWHGSYGIVAALGVTLLAWLKVYTSLTSSSSYQTGKEAIGRFVGNETVHGVVSALIKAVALLIAAAVVAAFGYELYSDPRGFLLSIGVAVGLSIVAVVGIIAFVIFLDLVVEPLLVKAGSSVKKQGAKVGAVSKKTPLVRRVYGKCPVSMSIKPKWFQKIFEADVE